MGYWNAKHIHWHSRLTTPKGSNPLRIITNNRYFYSTNGEPTCWPTVSNKLPDLIDFFILHGIPSRYLHIESSLDLSSDHSPDIATFSTHAIIRSQIPKLVSHRTNWNVFHTYIETNLKLNVKLKHPYDIDNAIHYLTTVIQDTKILLENPLQQRPITVKKMLIYLYTSDT